MAATFDLETDSTRPGGPFTIYRVATTSPATVLDCSLASGPIPEFDETQAILEWGGFGVAGATGFLFAQDTFDPTDTKVDSILSVGDLAVKVAGSIVQEILPLILFETSFGDPAPDALETLYSTGVYTFMFEPFFVGSIAERETSTLFYAEDMVLTVSVVQPVPLPAGAWLGLTGLAALGAVRLRARG